MKVILFQDIVKIGTAGEVKEVANGFARNYLLPRQIAHLATPANLKRWESEKKNRKIELEQSLEKAKSLASEIQNITLDLYANAGREEHLFGSITAQGIAEALLEKGFSVDKKNIILDAPIKMLGEYQVTLKLHSQVTPSLKVKVLPKSS
ncbi:MAG: 50S ribosomal protein L9 [Elusimicrobia bacterium RIFCSPLOWO2_02_FULL_39_32]|nr:MAG: 50S ribosomal protein L9 [Elusimicrobia bacterium GWA2_38_7]OGR80020.1 MAG: 50S ribosomal protein L9 [Elusimicrobia bacterium RIFCSPHIGHO2_02_FULL_39_36]OGR91185.1 MAG: 50S ribosomal protein L9 [Elusimicrobia bacterium RIFCSPLOWO2_02_FULL_39_32]OGS00153.1 MAG: 50S ribosomal protein L9 [Elusimicrobia bacterium RIFCSPLOWO2_12_FULL_39_28]